MDAFDGVTAVSKLFDEKIDVYIHGDQYTQGWCGGKVRIFGAVWNRSCQHRRLRVLDCGLHRRGKGQRDEAVSLTQSPSSCVS
jgi:hypothetical protein